MNGTGDNYNDDHGSYLWRMFSRVKQRARNVSRDGRANWGMVPDADTPAPAACWEPHQHSPKKVLFAYDPYIPMVLTMWQRLFQLLQMLLRQLLWMVVPDVVEEGDIS